MNSHFRYSPELWPNAELPVPRVARAAVLLDPEGWLVRDHEAGWWSVEAPPVEMHLREMRDVDLSDPESIRRMCEATGEVLDDARPYAGVSSPRTWPSVALLNHKRAVENIAEQLDLPRPDWDGRRGVHVSEVAARIVFVRALVDHLERAMTERPTAPVWQAAGFFDPEEDDAAADIFGLRALESEDAETLAWWYFAEILNDGLTGVSPRLIPPPIESQPDIGDVADAYTAACVLIFNDLHSGSPYRRCADETCGRIFRRQVGRSSGAFSRAEGVAFCSPRHARNQSQRERRRRARAERARED